VPLIACVRVWAFWRLWFALSRIVQPGPCGFIAFFFAFAGVFSLLRRGSAECVLCICAFWAHAAVREARGMRCAVCGLGGALLVVSLGVQGLCCPGWLCVTRVFGDGRRWSALSWTLRMCAVRLWSTGCHGVWLWARKVGGSPTLCRTRLGVLKLDKSDARATWQCRLNGPS